MQRIIGSLVGIAMLALGLPATAQVNTADAQRKLLSKRAAEADAYRKLAECVKGLQITSDTYVKDFVAESDDIRAAMDDFIRGIRLGPPTWYADGSCEVPAEVTVEKVIETLRQIHTRFYKGNRIKGSDFNDIQRRVETRVIKVVGMGAPREDLPPNLPAGVAEQLKAPPPPPQPPIPELWRRMGPRARFSAIRAAELDAKRQLLERIRGLRINSQTVVRDFVMQNDSITAQAQGLVIGATIVRTYLHDDEPIAEVTVEVPTESVVEIVKQLHSRSIHGDDIKGTDVTEITKSIASKTFQATGMGIPKQEYLQALGPQPGQPPMPAWAMQTLTATGSGLPPEGKAGTAQGKLLAARAAELDARRKLVEHAYGLSIRSDTTVRDLVARHDEIRTHIDAVLVGAVVERTEYDGDTAHVTVTVPGMQVWGVVSDALRREAAPKAPPAEAPPPGQ